MVAGEGEEEEETEAAAAKATSSFVQVELVGLGRLFCLFFCDVGAVRTTKS